MAQENVDYSYATLLADARAKRDAWDAVIASLEKVLAMGSGAPGALGSEAGFSGGAAVELPLGALMGKSVSNAIKIYMAACKKKQTTKEIAAALKEGGVESTSKNFDVIVNNTLRALKKAGVILQFKEGWGLAELYPESIRNRIAQQANGESKKPKRRKSASRKSTPAASAKPNPGAPKKVGMDQIDFFLHINPTKWHTVSEITSELGAGAGVQLTLGKLLKAGRVQRSPEGKYSIRGNVQEMPIAS